jgi:transcriptional regulator with XRE-family HTH domain
MSLALTPRSRESPDMSTDRVDAYKAERARYLKAFGANVRRLRSATEPRMSQERLADDTDLHRTEIGKIEQGAIEPRLMTFVIVAAGLGASLDELVEGLWVPVERNRRSHDR